MREPKVVDDADDGVPHEVFGGDTQKLDSAALIGLIEKSEGHEVAQKFAEHALGTPKLGMPQLAEDDEPIVELARGSVSQVMPAAIAESVPEMRKPSRFTDLAIGGLISLAAMIAWYCATQL